MTVIIPMKDNETVEEIEDKLIDAVDSVGSAFTGYHIEVEEDTEE